MARDGHAQQLSVFLLLAGVGHVLCQPIYIEAGKSHTFEPSVNTAFESVLWKFNNDKVVEYEDKIVRWFQFENQGDFDKITGDLKLNGLTKSHSGSYESEILVGNPGTLQTKKFEIKVIDAVQEPQVECLKDNEGRVTSLECFLKPEVDGVSFTWGGPGDKKTPGKTFQITEEMRKDHNALFFCTATNQLGGKHTEFYLRTCVPEGGNHTGAIVGVVGALVLVIGIVIGIVVAVYFRKKRTGAGYNTPPQNDEEARTDIPMQNNTSNSNNCTKDEVKDLEGPKNIGNGNTEKEQEDQDDSGSENQKPDLPNTVNHSDERAEADQEMPKSPEKGQGDTPTPQETPDEDKNSMNETNGDADPPRDEEPKPVIGNDTNNEESAEGQSEETALIEASSQAASRVRGTIAQFESMAWKPRELTTRDAGQKNSAA